MDKVMTAKRGGTAVVDPDREAPAGRSASAPANVSAALVSDNLPSLDDDSVRSDVGHGVAVPTPPFCGTRVVKGIALADYAAMLDERAHFLGQWGLRGSRGGTGPSYEELVETEGRRAAVLAGPARLRPRARGGRGLRLLPVRIRGQRRSSC
jgi:5-methyltetrahydrofolate--homocysteine methyltransferase